MDLKSPLDKMDVSLIRGAISVFLLFVIYVCISLVLTNSINKKNEELSSVKADVQTQIALANTDLTKLQAKLSTYTKLRENLEQMNSKTAENNKAKNSVPNFLYHIMNVIPDNVEITEIQNTTDSHVVITARSHDYQHLAYFTAALKQGGVFYNVISGTAEKIKIREVKEEPAETDEIISLKTESRIVKDAEKGYTTEKTQKVIIEKEIIQVTIEGDLQ